MSDYGEKFETATIVAMSAIIILSLVAVIAMNKMYRPECIPSYETYCGEQPAPH